MIDDYAKEYLHSDPRDIRETMLWTLDGGHVPWWPRPDVKLFNILVHMLTETSRHAGQADILREQLDGAVGFDADSSPRHGRDAAFWESHRNKIEQVAKAANPRQG